MVLLAISDLVFTRLPELLLGEVGRRLPMKAYSYLLLGTWGYLSTSRTDPHSIFPDFTRLDRLSRQKPMIAFTLFSSIIRVHSISSIFPPLAMRLELS